MGLEKGIEHKKEKRKEYRGAKSVDKECRNHGRCEYCKRNRLFNSMKRMELYKEEKGKERYEDRV